MNRTLLDYDWIVMAPELILVCAAVLLSLLDLVLRDEQRRTLIAWLSVLFVGFSLTVTLSQWGEAPYEILADTYRIDAISLSFKVLLLIGVLAVLLLSIADVRRSEIEYEGEYYTLLLTALIGAMLLVSSADLITLYVGLELLSISSYILVGIRKKRQDANEAAWKYVIYGGVSSAFFLYGLSFIYGITGSTNLYLIQEQLAEVFVEGFDLYIYLSLFLVLFGLVFKIASSPFHFWVPDVYQGASTPIMTWLAVVSKIAAFALLLRIVLIAYYPALQTEWVFMVESIFVAVAVLSLVIGNTVALRQTHTKRMLAYSSIGHVGFLILPVAMIGPLLFNSLLFYLLAYMLATVGLLTIVAIVERETEDEHVSAFAGLNHRSPLLAFATVLFALSLAGIPITVGFFAKLHIFLAVLMTRSFWIAGLMVLMTVISYGYYFELVRQMYFRPIVVNEQRSALRLPWTGALLVGLSLVGVIGFGIFPGLILDIWSSLDWRSSIFQ
ncbi:NADH-quinone oxidoreductase subunit N [Mechercharimyces sp. CAU 1602]|uniref:NADH-quinone oxidoreductase subunit N n=1 Tax=Mechercharimyces sp. CAU 1602 TaxID=2973933 RepID=UPI00216155D7|nr:NADH-quinone oxidoreductase subunit N [Mechercharimyces sp. CAU 1602]MCS1352267.1 NADH-quinone oxidoreductase subunit N [Mechercharimyces sp. CAU 1602]